MKWFSVLLVPVGVAFGEWYIETVNNTAAIRFSVSEIAVC